MPKQNPAYSPGRAQVDGRQSPAEAAYNDTSKNSMSAAAVVGEPVICINSIRWKQRNGLLYLHYISIRYLGLLDG